MISSMGIRYAKGYTLRGRSSMKLGQRSGKVKTHVLPLSQGSPAKVCNEDLRTELEYFSEDYDEEREMEPRPEPNWEATLTLQPRSPMVLRQQERVVGFEEAPNREGSKRGRNVKGKWSTSPILFDLRTRRPSAFD
ncbi:hypothetical protein Tco_1511472 [Tanacetum coccineum]